MKWTGTAVLTRALAEGGGTIPVRLRPVVAKAMRGSNARWLDRELARIAA
jgi:hypothetical protein